MVRTCVAVLALAFLCSVALADQIRGKVKSVNANNNTITVTVDDKDQTVDVAKTAKIYSLGKAKKGQAPPEELVAGGLAGLGVGKDVTIYTEKKDGKETATSIKLEAMTKKKKDKNTN